MFFERLSRRRFLAGTGGILLAQGQGNRLYSYSQGGTDLIDITIRERDGLLRRAVPFSMQINLRQAQLPMVDSLRLIDEREAEQVFQLDVRDRWQDGSVRTGDLTFRVTVDPLQVRHFRLEPKDPSSAEAQLTEPLQVKTRKENFEIGYGPIWYGVNGHQFQGIEQVDFEEQQFHRRPGPMISLRKTDGRRLPIHSVSGSQLLATGPLWVQLRVDCHHAEGYRGVCDLHFFYGKSWVLIEYSLRGGDRNKLASIEAETAFHLPAGPLHSAFGARERFDGVSTNWVVVTDRVTTVDVASQGAWKGAETVRHELTPGGIVRTSVPLKLQPLRLYYHYLNGPPDDNRNTPAATMVATLEGRTDS